MSEKQTKQNNNSGIKMLIVLLVAAIWILALIMLALIISPDKSAIPEFEITDKRGEWGSQGTIAVFDEMINPGSEGEYNFVIKSLSDASLRYIFVMEEEYKNGNSDWASFMRYRLKMNGKYVDTDEWRSIDEMSYSGIIILPGTRQLFTLEWSWPFENGTDDNDTDIGIKGGSYSVIFHLTAEVIEEEVE